MRFSVLIEIYCGFAVLGNFLCGFSVSNRPQCPPHVCIYVLNEAEGPLQNTGESSSMYYELD